MAQSAVSRNLFPASIAASLGVGPRRDRQRKPTSNTAPNILSPFGFALQLELGASDRLPLHVGQGGHAILKPEFLFQFASGSVATLGCYRRVL